MGTTRWCPEDWARYVDKTSHKSRSEIFKHNLERDLDPRYIKRRESCDLSQSEIDTDYSGGRSDWIDGISSRSIN